MGLVYFVLDAIPHWDYYLASKDKKDNPLEEDMKINKDFIFDLFKIGGDFFLGLLIVGIFIKTGIFSPFSLFCGFLGGVTPDFLQFIYFKFKHEPLTSLHRFHHWIHAEKRLNDHPVRGITYQLLIIFVAILSTRFF